MPFQEYSPEQAALLPVHVRDVLSEKHLVFLISAVVEKQDLSAWESAYSQEGQRPYHPALLLKVLLYGFALGVRSSRKLEQRVREDLGFRYLAGGAEPDHKTICEFLRRHGRRVNDLFTTVLEQLQAAGLGKLGVVALDATRVKANASRDRVITEAGLRAERARKRRQVRKWECDLAAREPEENPGGLVAELERVRQRLAEIPGELQKLRKSGQKKMSRTDADSRFLHSRDGFVLGYTAEAVVSEEGLIVAARVTQAANGSCQLGAASGRSRATLRTASRESAGRRGILFQPKCGNDGGAGRRVVRSGLSAGARDETRPASSGSSAHSSSGTPAGTATIALPGGAEAVRATQRHDRACVRNPQRASRHAEILSPRTGGRECGIPVDGFGLQLDATPRNTETLSNRNWAKDQRPTLPGTEDPIRSGAGPSRDTDSSAVP